MKTFRAPALAFVGLLSWALAAAAAPDFGKTVRDFSANRHRLVQDLATRLNLPVPPEVEPFFQAARSGDWPAASNQLARLKAQNNHSQTAIAPLMNELWAPIHETWGLYEVWMGLKEDSGLMAMFTGPILASMPAGSIYFGGTDAGRFAITAVNALQDPPPVFCLTQNALADNSYLAYLRATCDDRIWLPTLQDSNKAFQQYVADVKEGRIPAGAGINIEGGKVQVQGVAGVMQINSLLAQTIFDRNKDAHPFFVEESYVLNWMYPYLEPHGLILKLHPEPLKELAPETIDRDTRVWAELEQTLMSSPGFADNYAAGKMFSKLRCAIAGVYDYRRLYPEAEAAYRQACRLCPTAPETHFRLAQMLANQQRLDDAIRVLENFLAATPTEGADTGKEFLSSLMKARHGNETDEEPSSGSTAFEK